MATKSAGIETQDNGTTKTGTRFTAAADVGLPVKLSPWGDVSVQCVGTKGTSFAMTVQGSNDGNDWCTLTDLNDDAISLTDVVGLNLQQIAQVPLYIRPLMTAQAGATDIACILVMRRNNPSRP